MTFDILEREGGEGGRRGERGGRAGENEGETEKERGEREIFEIQISNCVCYKSIKYKILNVATHIIVL